MHVDVVIASWPITMRDQIGDITKAVRSLILAANHLSRDISLTGEAACTDVNSCDDEMQRFPGEEKF